MLRVQSLDHNIITGSFRVEHYHGTQRNRVRVQAGRDSCVRENKGVLTLGNLNRARARLNPKARFI